jgi:hypothetical protein
MERAKSSKFLICLLVASIVLFVVPFILYFHARYFGNLPTKEEWFIGTNHGPWRWELKGYLIIWPFLLLAPLSLIGGIWAVSRERNFKTFGSVFILIALQAGFFWAHAHWLFWLVD